MEYNFGRKDEALDDTKKVMLVSGHVSRKGREH